MSEQRTVTVTGRGSASAVPDAATVAVAAVHRARSLVDALAGAESAREAAVATGREAAPGATVSSRDLTVWPRTDHEGRPAGFEARHALALRCAGLDEAGRLVGLLAERVGDRLQVEGVSLVTSDTRAAEGAAREAAYADARARAEHLAALAGAALGTVERVVEGAADGIVLEAGAARTAAAPEVGLEPGVTTVASALTVTWTLEGPG